MLREGGAVATDPRLLVNGEVILGELTEDAGPRYTDTLTVPAHLLTTGSPRYSVIVSPEAARAAGLVPQLGTLLFTTERMPTQAEQDAFLAALAEVGTTGYVASGPVSLTRAPMLLLLMAAAGLIALGAAGIATGLAAADRRADLSTLAAVGAPPRVRRLLSLHQSGVDRRPRHGARPARRPGCRDAVLVAMNQRSRP